ncbi:MAG: chorismate-binding protein [Candidatus Synechococcus spongiarum SP3]|uniref:Chromophore lyase CpcT/CpeT n=1 Tax=Candidatus Synechococcus spongiarum SP3 TaxID=1604020 RepID=A0A0G2HLD8_9SYNE|nr:MAG: chorismate-binding protein [Candidatus Synechococcus spongiarum SP3]
MALIAQRLLAQLSGAFSNEAQALANPPLFASIQVVFRPTPQLAPGSLLLEQAYALDPSQPYRIRLLRVRHHQEQGLIIENWALHHEERFYGATMDPERLVRIQQQDLTLLLGCTYLVETAGDGFRGEVEPGGNCRVRRGGRDTYLVSRFEVGEGWLRTTDQGFDLQTHDHVWGGVAGAFEFERTSSFAAELPESW